MLRVTLLLLCTTSLARPAWAQLEKCDVNVKSAQVRYHAGTTAEKSTVVEIALKLHVVDKDWKNACNLAASHETGFVFDDKSIVLPQWERRGSFYTMPAGGKPVFSKDPEFIYTVSFPAAYSPAVGTLSGKLHFLLLNESGQAVERVREIQIPYDLTTAKSIPRARGRLPMWVNVLLVPVRVVTETGKIILGQAGS